MSTKNQTNSMIEIDKKNLYCRIQYKNNLQLLIDLYQYMRKPFKCNHPYIYFFSDDVQVTLKCENNATKLCFKYNDTWYIKRFRRTNTACFMDICDKLYQYDLLDEVDTNMLIFILAETYNDFE